MKSQTYILGSGKSMLSLSTKQVEMINNSELIISLNKFLLFYEKIGIIPTCHLQLDSIDVASLYVFLKTLNKLASDSNFDYLELFCNRSMAKMAKKYISKQRINIVNYDPTLWDKTDFFNQNWSESLDNSIFHFRGSLTSAINLATILKPGNLIRLIGVDMDSNEYFFQNEYELDKRLHDWTYQIMKEKGQHSSIIKTEKFNDSSQEDCFAWILEQVRKRGGDIVSSTPGAYYEKIGIIDYLPVVECKGKGICIDKPINTPKINSRLPISMELEIVKKRISVAKMTLFRRWYIN